MFVMICDIIRVIFMYQWKQDRNIIAHAISNKCSLISSDKNFPLYEPYGLKYIDV